MKVKILLIGIGQMGYKNYYPLLEGNNNSTEIIGIVRQQFHIVNGNNVPTFPPEKLEYALRETRPNLVVISTPHYLHYQQTKIALQHDCNVLVEKPLGLEFAQSEELVEMAEKKGKLLVVNLQRRYEGPAEVFREVKAAGKLGKINFVHGFFSHQFAPKSFNMGRWRLDAEKGGAGIIDDSAFHLIDLMLYYSGGGILEKNYSANYMIDKNVPHTFACMFQTENGTLVSASGSYLAPQDSVQEEISIIGDKGSLYIRRFLMTRNTNQPIVYYKSFDGKDSYKFNLSDRPIGRLLPIITTIEVLLGKKDHSEILTTGKQVLETHKAISLIKSGVKIID